VVRVAKLIELLDLIRWGEPWDVEEDDRTGDKVSHAATEWVMTRSVADGTDRAVGTEVQAPHTRPRSSGGVARPDRTAFVLSDGGSLGAVQVGMLSDHDHAAGRRGGQPDDVRVVGTSVVVVGFHNGALTDAHVRDLVSTSLDGRRLTGSPLSTTEEILRRASAAWQVPTLLTSVNPAWNGTQSSRPVSAG
jgi:hypothetical protein